MRILIIGTYFPRKCGIATFTRDLFQSLMPEKNQVDIIAVSDGTENKFPVEVKRVIDRNNKQDYIDASIWANSKDYDCCIIQHEFGIFGGEAGSYILSFAYGIRIPLIANLHTVLEKASLGELDVMDKLTECSFKITVMTDRAVQMLENVYHVNPKKIENIPHGVPEFLLSRLEAKIKLGLKDKRVILSFGLLGRSKGYEVAIDAMSKVRHADFVYIILGATHPNVLKEEGDLYRDSLKKRVRDLDLENRVLFVDEFVNDEQLQTYLKACDIYVTPYPNENQMSSGTLTFALAAGAAVISTPYWYAKDLLQEGRGLLFDFNDSDTLAKLINQLFSDVELLEFYRSNALSYGTQITWTTVGKTHLRLMSKISRQPSTVPAVGCKENIIPLLSTSFSHKLLNR